METVLNRYINSTKEYIVSNNLDDKYYEYIEGDTSADTLYKILTETNSVPILKDYLSVIYYLKSLNELLLKSPLTKDSLIKAFEFIQWLKDLKVKQNFFSSTLLKNIEINKFKQLSECLSVYSLKQRFIEIGFQNEWDIIKNNLIARAFIILNANLPKSDLPQLILLIQELGEFNEDSICNYLDIILQKFRYLSTTIQKDLVKNYIQALDLEKFNPIFQEKISELMKEFDIVPTRKIQVNELKYIENIYKGYNHTDNMQVEINKYEKQEENGSVLVAIKIIRAPPSILEKCHRECLIYESLSRSFDLTYFLKYYGSTKSCNELKIIMEYCDLSLQHLLLKRKPNHYFSDLELQTSITDLIQGFSLLITKGIFHRDIKPDNILIASNGKPKIIDFNVSLNLEKTFEKYKKDDLRTFVGTPMYLAPEIMRFYNDYRSGSRERVVYNPELSDVFSLGLVIYEIATLKSINNFNIEERYATIAVNQVNILWVQNLLRKMILFNPDNRATFAQLLHQCPGMHTIF